MVAPRLILFDVDGTLLWTGGAGRYGLERAFEIVFGVERMSDVAGHVEYAGRTDPAILRDLAAAAGVDAARYRAASDRVEEVYLEHLRRRLAARDSTARLLPGVAALLDALAARPDVHLGLVTGNVERGARAKLEPFGLNPRFPTGGFGSDHERRPELARIARERAERRAGVRFDPRHVWVVGDTEHDVDCARAQGFRALALRTGGRTRERLAACRPDRLLDDLADTAEALRALDLS